MPNALGLLVLCPANWNNRTEPEQAYSTSEPEQASEPANSSGRDSPRPSMNPSGDIGAGSLLFMNHHHQLAGKRKEKNAKIFLESPHPVWVSAHVHTHTRADTCHWIRQQRTVSTMRVQLLHVFCGQACCCLLVRHGSEVWKSFELVDFEFVPRTFSTFWVNLSGPAFSFKLERPNPPLFYLRCEEIKTKACFDKKLFNLHEG